MRLLRLELLRYGHLADVALEFPAQAPLHVVLGGNEAGKSTALEAIGDALFGFPHRTTQDYLYPTAQLRIGFSVMDGEGRASTFIRRKGRGETLLDAEGNPIPEAELQRFLGRADRELFERAFGLDGERLRQGARELQASGGEAGESLLAGGGLLNLRDVLKELEEQAKLLHGDGRGRRRISEALERVKKARQAQEQAAVAPAAWQKAERTRQDAVDELVTLQKRSIALQQEASRLARFRRTAPILAGLDAARQRIAEIGIVPTLPDDLDERRKQSVTTAEDARRDADQAAEQIRQLEERRATLVTNDVLLAAQERVDRLEAQRPVRDQAAVDLPSVEAEAATHRATVMATLVDLPNGLTPEAARDAVPSLGARQQVQQLIAAHGKLATALGGAKNALAEQRQAATEAEQALVDVEAEQPPDLLQRVIDEVRAEGRLDEACAEAEGNLQDRRKTLSTALAALPLWTGDLAALRDCQVPLSAEQASASEALVKADEALKAALDSLDNHRTEHEEQVERRALLLAGASVPTPQAVAAARQLRDRSWQAIRAALEKGAASPVPSEDFEFEVAEADRLADRSVVEAQRVANFLDCEARLRLLDERSPTLLAAAEAAKAGLQQAEAGWQRLWAKPYLLPGSPEAMREWQTRRDHILALDRECTSALRRAEDLANRRTNALATLAKACAWSAVPGTLAAALREADVECQRQEEAARHHADLVKARGQATKPLARLQDRQADAERDLTAWQADWGQAMRALGLPTELSLTRAAATVDAWASVAEVAVGWRTAEARVTAMLLIPTMSAAYSGAMSATDSDLMSAGHSD